MNTFGADTDEDVTDWGQENVEQEAREFSRKVETTLATNNDTCLTVDLMYDATGQITTDPTACYMVDAEGEISRIVEPGEVITTRVRVLETTSTT